MEDYLEMIYRLNKDISVKELAATLNVKPSSVSKMAKRLKELNLIAFEKYQKIKITKQGLVLGKYFLKRHNILKNFFKILNKDQYNLKQVEKIEHFIDYKTIVNIEKWLKK
ncbi:MAG: metal-dependent transcriptional regulator [Bacilli bacterium]